MAQQKIRDALSSFDKEKTLQEVSDAIASKGNPREIFDELVTEMKEIGEKFGRMEVFLPEVMIAAESMQESFKIIMPEMIEAERPERVGVAVFGTVKGDIHNVGKDMVISVMQTQGFEVYDLGTDVATSKFFDAAESYGADIVCICAIMSSTIPYQRDIIEYFNEKGKREQYKILVGGGSTTPEWAEKIGADGWGKDAVEGTNVALRLLGKETT